MATIILLPDPRSLQAARQAVRHRASHLRSPAERRDRALATVVREMTAGRSAGAAIALALSDLTDRPTGRLGGAA